MGGTLGGQRETRRNNFALNQPKSRSFVAESAHEDINPNQGVG